MGSREKSILDVILIILKSKVLNSDKNQCNKPLFYDSVVNPGKTGAK